MTESTRQDTIEEIRGRLSEDAEVREMISMRAYELYLNRGAEAGRDTEDWLRAENEILTILVQEELRSPAPHSMPEHQAGGNSSAGPNGRSARKKAGEQSLKKAKSASKTDKATSKPSKKTGGKGAEKAEKSKKAEETEATQGTIAASASGGRLKAAAAGKKGRAKKADTVEPDTKKKPARSKQKKQPD